MAPKKPLQSSRTPHGGNSFIVGQGSDDALLDAANDAINKVFGDTSVSKATTRERLNDLASNIDIMLETIDDSEPSLSEQADT